MPPKVDFPKFDRTYPRAWILRCNAYFRMVPTVLENQKVDMATMYFEGKAALWYQTYGAKNIGTPWPEFVDLISARFEQLQETQIIEDFHKIKQYGSYMDYVDRFEKLKEHIRLLNRDTQPELYYVASFLSGLNDELKSAIRMFKPKTLQDAIELGRDQSANIDAITKKIKNNTKSYGSATRNTTIRNPVQNYSGGSFKTPPTKGPMKVLTAAEMSVRREKGLCFNFDEKFVSGHKCKHNSTFMILGEDDELVNTLLAMRMERLLWKRWRCQ